MNNKPKIYGNRCPPIDTKELLKLRLLQQGNDSQEYNKPTIIETNQLENTIKTSDKPINDVGFFDTYIEFDSFSKVEQRCDLTNGKLAWDISKFLISGKSIENVISIQIESFHIPLIKNPDPLGNEFYFFREAFIGVTSLPSQTGFQCLYDNSKKNYHFSLSITNPTSGAPYCETRHDTYYSPTPITTLDTFDIQLMVPPKMKSVPLFKDVVYCRALGGTAGHIQLLDATIYEIIPNGVIAPGDTVAAFIDNFISTDSTVNNSMTSTYGIQIDSIINDNTVAASAISFATILDTNGRMMIGVNRISIGARFTSVGTNKTNMLTNVHL